MAQNFGALPVPQNANPEERMSLSLPSERNMLARLCASHPKQRNPHSNSALCLHARIDVACSTQLSRSRSVREDRTPLPGVSGDNAFHRLPSLCRNFSQQTIIKIIRHASCCQDLQFSSVEKFPLICTLS